MDGFNNSVKLAGSRAFPLVVGLDFGCPFYLMVPESETNFVEYSVFFRKQGCVLEGCFRPNNKCLYFRITTFYVTKGLSEKIVFR